MAFDMNDCDYIFGSGDTRIDPTGHLMRRVGKNLAMDLETGDIHFVSGWGDDDDEN